MGIEQVSEIETTGEGATSEDRQGLIDHYATLTLQQLIWGPFSPAPEIIRTAQRPGPFDRSRKSLMCSAGEEI